MNTVDPGFVSAGASVRWAGEDGTGRVLWRVTIEEVEGEAVWGRFPKYYEPIDVEADLNQ